MNQNQLINYYQEVNVLRKMGLDIGNKRIGIAISDSLNYTAQGKEVLIRKNHQQDLKIIKNYIDKYQVDELVVGLPKNMDNSTGPQAKKVKNYFNFLRNNLEISVILWDERFSTKEAEKILIEADLSRADRKKVIDKVAASIILQGYLDYRKRQKNSGGNKSETKRR